MTAPNVSADWLCDCGLLESPSLQAFCSHLSLLSSVTDCNFAELPPFEFLNTGVMQLSFDFTRCQCPNHFQPSISDTRNAQSRERNKKITAEAKVRLKLEICTSKGNFLVYLYRLESPPPPPHHPFSPWRRGVGRCADSLLTGPLHLPVVWGLLWQVVGSTAC